jgi:predicted nucleic acid-binding protein
LGHRDLRALLEFFDDECDAGAFQWLPLSPAVLARLTKTYGELPRTVPLRAADAIHLACAVESGFKQAYSNDRQFLLAAKSFGLKGVNVIRG